MKEINVSQEPSQKFSVNLNNHNWGITLRDIGDSMLMDVELDGAALVSGIYLLPNQPLLPYNHVAKYGNFILLSESTEYPTWKTIGISSKLYFITPEEMREIANG